ncbi:MAG: hypothetical protein AB8H80_21720 [Planctomycetota bacterium]
MRLPLPFLLYTAALGLLGWTGWMIYESLPLWDRATRNAATSENSKKSSALMADGKGSGPVSSDWNYGASVWWEQFKEINLVGKLPPPPKDPVKDKANEPPPPPPVDMTPLEDIIELVAVMNSGAAKAESGDELGVATHVIVRYKPTANVEPPEWWVKENTRPERRASTPRDLAARGNVATRKGARGSQIQRPRPTARRGSQMPAMAAGGETFVQILWLDGDENDERHTNRLWPTYEHIKLVRVAPDALSAFFVRVLPPTAEGEPAPEQKEEELLQTAAEIPQDVLKALRELRPGGRSPATAKSKAKSGPASGSKWRDVESTTRFGNEFHIGRKDQTRFRRSADDFLNSVSVDTYVSKVSNKRGLSVRSVDTKMAGQFGVTTGDVLLEINGREVASKAQAVNRVKKDFNRGVRSFVTVWLSNGQRVERVYQAPPGN